MTRKTGNRIASWLVMLLIISSCSSKGPDRQEYVQYAGKTMGTTYSVKHEGVGADFQPLIDSVLLEVNMALSTYIPESVISRFNIDGKLHLPTSELTTHFEQNLKAALDVYSGSQGAFDPTVGPLINAWGFGWEGRQPTAPSKDVIDSLLQLVGMSRLQYREAEDSLHIEPLSPGMQLDFSAIAKGYGVDVVAGLLEQQGIRNYFVEIGGEVRTKGVNPSGNAWVVGVSTPAEGAAPMDFYAKVKLSGKSMATSGNYRNYYLVEGQKIWHTIDPKTGYPEQNPVLSASIVYDNCMMADAMATACLVMGEERCLNFISEKGGAAYLIINDPETGTRAAQTGFDKYLLEK